MAKQGFQLFQYGDRNENGEIETVLSDQLVYIDSQGEKKKADGEPNEIKKWFENRGVKWEFDDEAWTSIDIWNPVEGTLSPKTEIEAMLTWF